MPTPLPTPSPFPFILDFVTLLVFSALRGTFVGARARDHLFLPRRLALIDLFVGELIT